MFKILCTLYVRAYLCVRTCVYRYINTCLHVEATFGCQVSSSIIRHFPLILLLTDWLDSPASPRVTNISAFPFPFQPPNADMCHHAWLFCGCRGFKLRASCLHAGVLLTESSFQILCCGLFYVSYPVWPVDFPPWKSVCACQSDLAQAGRKSGHSG